MKARRHALILQIIANRDIETQEQLQQILQEAGYFCTQATISRDIKELRLIKEMTGTGSYRYAPSTKEMITSFSNKMATIFRECVTSYDYAQNLVVINTLPGLAAAAATAVDSMHTGLVLGSVAGYDTVLIIMRDVNAAAGFCNQIKMTLNG